MRTGELNGLLSEAHRGGSMGFRARHTRYCASCGEVGAGGGRLERARTLCSGQRFQRCAVGLAQKCIQAMYIKQREIHIRTSNVKRKGSSKMKLHTYI